jgi:heptosyltransferase-2
MKNRIILIIVQLLGFIMSKLPYFILEQMTEFLGWVLMSTPNSRRRLMLSNLSHAFPDWEYSKIVSVARESAARMFEMGFFSLSYPFMSKEQRRHTVFFDKKAEEKLEELRNTSKPVLFLLPHTCLFESLATSPLFRPFGGRSLGAIYRPNKNPALDAWITAARQNVGIKTFSRKEGIIKARAHLRECNWLVVLYDQNAGMRGTGSSFLGRICSISPLPDLLAKNKDIICVHATAKRVSFFRSRLELKDIAGNEKSTSESAHNHLAQEILKSPNGFAEWLWSHGKWKINNMIHEIFLLQDKFQKLDFLERGRQSNQIFIRMPNWLGDVVMALPVIRAIRMGRPDACISLVCKSVYVDLLKSLCVADKVYALPQSDGLKYFNDVWKLNLGPCDAMLMLTNSWRGDLESILLNAEVRLGIETRGKRLLLSDPLKASSFRNYEHQVSMWFRMLAKYSQYSPPSKTFFDIPFFGETDFSSSTVLIAPGSLNTPEKRLPIKNWVKLSEIIFSKNPNVSFKIIGTSSESIICNELDGNLKSFGIFSTNLCGKTNLVELSEIFKRSLCLLCNDSGAMHLANAVGLPVFAVFGSTIPERTGPAFRSPVKIYKSENDNFRDFSSEDGKSLQKGLLEFLEKLG